MTNEEKELAGRITSINLRMNCGYRLERGGYGIWHILDAQGKTVTSGTLAQLLARAESMLKDGEQKSSIEP